MTFDDLQQQGYTLYPVPRHEQFASRVAQKVIRENELKLYFINVTESLWPDGRTSIYADVHFYADSGGFKVERGADTLSVSELEAFFHHVYVSCNCVPDIYNND